MIFVTSGISVLEMRSMYKLSVKTLIKLWIVNIPKYGTPCEPSKTIIFISFHIVIHYRRQKCLAWSYNKCSDNTMTVFLLHSTLYTHLTFWMMWMCFKYYFANFIQFTLAEVFAIILGRRWHYMMITVR